MPVKGPTRVPASWEVAEKQGAPDYSTDVSRGKTIYGYILEPDESFFMALIIAHPTPGAYVFERAGIPSGVTVELIDVDTGLPGITPAVGYDYIIKELWIVFNQPVMFEMWQAGPAGYSCLNFPAANMQPAVQPLLTGWTRSQIEPINVSTTTNIRITNLGTGLAYGKCWIVGFMRPRAYTWF